MDTLLHPNATAAPTRKPTPAADATTRLLRTADVVTMIRRLGLPTVLRDLEAAIAAAYGRWAHFDKVARLAAHCPEGVLELMPTADATEHSFKVVNGHPGNHRHGLPTVMAYGVLSEMATGRPLLLSELTLTTALRTAATSVLAARHLARPDARSMALIGNGAQSEFQALAFHHGLGITELRLFDVDPAATAKLQRHLARVPRLTVKACAHIEAAVQGADIVTTVTADKRRATILTREMVEPGQHLNAVGGDCPGKTELHPDVLRQAAHVVVEYEPQSRIEGDVQQMPPDFPVTELWQVLAGEVPGRLAADALTVFDSVGFALEDHAALTLLRSYAIQHGLGEALELVPALADPRDLYALISG